ncbi:alpha/beta fold hydrolase [Phaeobacter sp. HF9A]|uniref:alpha/beta fold hydrolase n=1 Tax=Phaeobacter sp. HF9A TaxID=2721561 RepID=UPI001432179C|nr:alpha/beta fold hydrolase [Phaeobacter sp. HF9A]NIZ14669.1 alpha/beta fold hydrolase [Phaeobacter sp. HF9A]
MDFIMSCRGRDGDGYSNRSGAVKYLQIPSDADRLHRKQEVSKSAWAKALQAAAGARIENGKVVEKGHILFFVHGFNTEQFDMLERLRFVRKGLQAQGYCGAVVSFDWPSNGTALGYCADRRDARQAADELFYHGLRWLARLQTADCAYNIHVLAHSMGAFLVRAALDYGEDDHATAQQGWMISQLALVAADVSAKSMRKGSDSSSSLYRRCGRVTNYYSPFDAALQVSEVKRVGVQPRAGRVGLPEGHPESAVNLYCGKYFRDHAEGGMEREGVSWSHRWYFETPRFYEDLNHTLMGRLDREVIPTRAWTDRGNLALF